MDKELDWQDKFFKLSEKQIKKIKLTDKGIPKRPYKGKTKYTKEEFVKYIVDNLIYRLSTFEEKRRNNSKAPSRYYVYKYFGSWTNLKKEIYGLTNKKYIPQDGKAIIKLCAEYEITTWEKYKRHRKIDKDLFPSWRVVDKVFGCWLNLKRMIMGRMVSSIYERYLVLEKELGKVPTVADCRKHGVEIDYFRQKSMSKRELDEFNTIMKRWSDEAKKRDRKKTS